jgi:hypothetical protein
MISMQFLSEPADAQIFPGGFIEPATATSVRPLLTSLQIQAFMPERGVFLFPAPYLTQGIRLTNSSDCGGTDCVFPVGYSYWPNMNNHVGSDTILIFLSLNKNLGGTGPTLFSYHKVTEAVQNLGPLFDASSTYSSHSGDGWYFSATLPTKLYVYKSMGSTFSRYDVLAKTFEQVFDVTTFFGANRYIWQMHSSNDDRVHSGTLRDTSTFAELGCFAYREDTHQFLYYPALGAFDECQIDKSGRYLLIKDNVDGLNGEDNRIIDLETGTEKQLLDQNGAGGHSDNGFGYMAASDNWNSLPNATRVWDFAASPLQGPLIFYNAVWLPAPNHISHVNAKAGVPSSQQYVCGSGANRTNDNRTNEIFCFRLDGSLNALVVAPVMTDLNASGGGTDDYAKLPKGNLDVTGQYFLWTSNMAGNRLDAFIVKVPAQLLTGGADLTPPTVSITSPLNGATVNGTITVAANASDSTGVAGVQFKLDGANLGAEDITSPYSVLWDTSTLTGSHSLTAVARDAAGNTAFSSAITVIAADSGTPTALVGEWRFNEGSGTTASDSSGNGHAGSLIGGPTWTSGGIGYALSFDGVNDYVQVAHSTSLNAYPLTIAFWMKTGTTGTNGIVNKYLPASRNGYQVFTSGGNLCAWYFKDTSNYIWDGSGCSLSVTGYNDNQWHHVAFVADGSGGKLYVDGLQRAGLAWTGTAGGASTTQDLSIGQYPGSATPYFPGSLDEVRIYSGAMTAAEVLSLYNAAAPAADTVPPVLSAVAIGSITDTAATISWTTDTPATSQVEYGTTASYGSATALSTGLVTSHSQTLTGLQPSTIYHFRVLSADAAGNLSVSGDGSFTTNALPDTAPPVIPGAVAANITDRTATITWYTSEASTTEVEYGTTPAYGSSSAMDSTMVTLHSVTLSGLAPSTTYHYRVWSADAAGNPAVSGDYTFTTSATPDTGAPTTGGCGMIRPIAGRPSGPAQAADLLILLMVMLIRLSRNRVLSAAATHMRRLGGQPHRV